VVSPIFHVSRLDWDAPEASRFDAIMLTSRNAAAEAGADLQRYRQFPCYCVGEATAAAARQAGLAHIITGPADGAALIEAMTSDGVRRALHLCGRDHLDLSPSQVQIERRIVYRSDPVAEFGRKAVQALTAGALALVHSPRAGRVFADLVDQEGLPRPAIRVAAISAAAASALGSGWRSVAAAPHPRDQALLELAAKLCKNAAAGGLGQAE
jgi:uroporphyrinogen-III synthase